MSATFGNRIKITLFGESHGPAIGVTIDGLKPGIQLDINYLKQEMSRRAPGRSELATQRIETDGFRIISGYFNQKTTGAPLCIMIENENQNSYDYEQTRSTIRPSHADYTGFVKYDGFHDYRGGGHFSGRLTAPLVLVGAICKQLLEKQGIVIGSHIKNIAGIEDKSFEPLSISPQELIELHERGFSVLDGSVGEKMKQAIAAAKQEADSVGGIIECAVLGLIPGIGEPFFDSVESRLSQLLFSIPGVKGVEFGTGFELANLKGSQANDEFYIEKGKDNLEKVRTYSNHNGGILGGITNGMPLIFRVVIKPTPSIGNVQRTINIETMENCEIQVKGRHDPCIIPRALPVVEAAAAIALYDLMNK